METKRQMSCWLSAWTALFFVGCTGNQYELELQPTGETVRRELTCWRQQTVNKTTSVVAFPTDELEKLASAYEAAPKSEKAHTYQFAGTYTGQMPNDVGGSGTYTHWDSPLGSVSAYVERFRGDDDLMASLEQREQAVDRIVDLLMGWFSSELDGESGFDQLRQFMDLRFRRDLKNVSLYAWVSNTTMDDRDEISEELIVRVGQYLVEHSYLTPDQLPALARVLNDLNGQQERPIMRLVQRSVASKMGVAQDQPIPESLGFLADSAAWETSINRYLQQTDDYRRLLAEWGRKDLAQTDGKNPEATFVFFELFQQAFFPFFDLGQRDQLKVKLRATDEPFLTNGQWDEKDRSVQWSPRLLGATVSGSEYPTLLYAFWSQPDGEQQKKHFGRVILDGESLGSYCLWYRGLSPQEAREWDDFVGSLKPGGDLIKRMRSFRFTRSAGPKNEGEVVDIAKTPREMILQYLADGANAN